MAAFVAAIAVWGLAIGGSSDSFAAPGAKPAGPVAPPTPEQLRPGMSPPPPPPPEPQVEPALAPSAAVLGIAPEDRPRLVAVARMEGAAIDTKEAATALRATTSQIVATGRLGGLVQLRSDTNELRRRVESMALAAQVLAETESERGKSAP